MSKTIPVWLRVSAYLGASLGLLFLTWLSISSEIFSKIISPLMGLSMILFLEAVAQPDPQEMLKTPLHRLIWKYPLRHDRLVAGISSLVLFLLCCLTLYWISGRSHDFSWPIGLLIVLLCSLFPFGAMAAIRYRFGSPEMRADAIPEFIKRFLKRQDLDRK